MAGSFDFSVAAIMPVKALVMAGTMNTCHIINIGIAQDNLRKAGGKA